MKSSDLLPTALTIQPSRAGLSYYEILADGLIHSAVVLGVRSDEQFVERLAALAWANGAKLVQRDIPAAARVIHLLGQSLETGRSETLALCRKLATDTTGATDPFRAIRHHYGEKRQSRLLSHSHPADAAPIRRIIAEATLGGLLSRGLLPELYQAITEQTSLCRNEDSFLTTRLWSWTTGTRMGLPVYYPIIDLAHVLYEAHPCERDLVCESLGSDLSGILAQGDPWALSHWLKPAWRKGSDIASLAPDEVTRAVEEFDDEERTNNLAIYQQYVDNAGGAKGEVGLERAYRRYLERWNPYGFAQESTRALNPRMLALRAYDFAFWMAMISVRPAALAGRGGES